MFRYKATTEGSNKLGLREALQTYADGFWHQAGITPEHACSALSRKIPKTAIFRSGFSQKNQSILRETLTALAQKQWPEATSPQRQPISTG